MVLLGFRGSGKSSTGNTVLGRKRFIQSAGQVQITTEIKAFKAYFNNTAYTVLDTPAISSKDDLDNILLEVDQKYNSDEKYFFLVMRVGRVQPKEINFWMGVLEVLGNMLHSRSAMIFTCVNELAINENNQETLTIDEYVQKSSSLNSLINTNNLKYFPVDNYAWSWERKNEFRHELVGSTPRATRSSNFLRSIEIMGSTRETSSSGTIDSSVSVSSRSSCIPLVVICIIALFELAIAIGIGYAIIKGVILFINTR